MSKFIPNSFQMPNAIVDEFLYRISGNAFKCYALIARQTTGWQKQSDKISVSQFMDKCNIKDPKTAYKVLAELEDIRLIIAFKKKGEITEFSLNFDFDSPTKEPQEKIGSTTKNSIDLVGKNGSTTTTKNPHTTKDTIKNNITNNTLTGINAHTHEAKRSAVLVLLEQFGITGKLAEDFIVHRKAKKAPITETALKGFQREADKAGIPIQQAVEIAVERGWIGFKADWKWQDDQPKQHRPKDNMRAEWNTPEAWAEVL
ncbi:replication protein [Mannheimia varigena]|uniref:replication protein n=1 Tax=Mannheimia varigena TaxID=85404 RepID=UPI001484FAE3|nr:replication protein [Mannheimia varigena]